MEAVAADPNPVVDMCALEGWSCGAQGQLVRLDLTGGWAGTQLGTGGKVQSSQLARLGVRGGCWASDRRRAGWRSQAGSSRACQAADCCQRPRC